MTSHVPLHNDVNNPRPKEDTKGKRKAEEEGTVPEELLAALNFADLEGPIPPWASGGKNWDPENGGLTERHIQVTCFVSFFRSFFRSFFFFFFLLFSSLAGGFCWVPDREGSLYRLGQKHSRQKLRILAIYFINRQRKYVRTVSRSPRTCCFSQALLTRVPWSEGCALCGRDDSPDKTLICDRCDREIHMFCLEPKLKKVWHLQRCRPASKKPKSKNGRLRLF